MTLGERLLGQVQRSPERPSIYLQQAGRTDVEISYRRLWSGSERYATTYRKHEIKPGEVVVLILQHGQDLVFSFWGAIIAGAVPSIMPFLTEKLSPEQYEHDLKALISVTKPAAILTYPEFLAKVNTTAQNSGVRVVLSTDDVSPEEEHPTGQTLPAQPAPSSIVLLQHSSGTTGLQKGVALSHEAVLHQLDAYGKALGLRDDVIASWLPLYHDMGLIAGFLLPILSGIPLVLSSPFDWVRAPWRFLQSASRYQATLSWLPNFAFNFMAQKVRDRDLEGVDLKSWRGVINCSEPVRWESHREFHTRFEPYGLRWESLQTCYAMAENVFGVTQSPLGQAPTVQDIDGIAFTNSGFVQPALPGRSRLRLMSSGRPLENTRVRILGDDGRDAPNGKVGEVALQSDCMLSGYYHRPDVDASAFREGWYLTGDRGFLLLGELFVVGRKKDLIIVGGKNIHPQDLEALSFEVPGIHPGRSVAFGVFDEELGTEEVYIVAEAATEDPDEQLRLAELVRQHVTRHSAVALRHVRIVGPKWILKTSSGKTARAANRDKYLREAGGAAEHQE